MHSLKYNALVWSLPGSSWVELLTIAVVTLQSLPAFHSIKISKFPSNSKANITCITPFLYSKKTDWNYFRETLEQITLEIPLKAEIDIEEAVENITKAI
jgi:hypothetical protein